MPILEEPFAFNILGHASSHALQRYPICDFLCFHRDVTYVIQINVPLPR